MKFTNGLPDVPVTDLVVEDNAIAIGTHGRSFYVMDDIAALRQFGLAPLTDVAVFKPANATRGLDRPIVTYYLKAQPKQLTIDFLDAKGQVVRSVNGTAAAQAGRPAAGGGDDDFPRGPQGAPMAAGVNRFTWDLNSTGVVTFPGMILWGATQNGPAVLPGAYQVRLTADGVTQTQPFQVLKHPLRPISDADLQFQWNLASRIRDKVNEANLAVIRIRRIKTDIADRIKDAPAEVRTAGEQLAKALSAVEEDVYQVKNQSGQDPLNFPIKTNNRLASLLRVAVSGEGRPTGNVEPIFNDLIAELKAETDRLEKTIADQLPPFNNMLQRHQEAAGRRQVVPGEPSLTVAARRNRGKSNTSFHCTVELDERGRLHCVVRRRVVICPFCTGPRGCRIRERTYRATGNPSLHSAIAYGLCRRAGEHRPDPRVRPIRPVNRARR